ncbi:Hok/Gef family protein [Winslowiella arboricola]|uniref:Hok/Gef family protein n=1 Tax=Winslowiella arboricola TaxID=2978220 RepID=UPI003899DDF8
MEAMMLQKLVVLSLRIIVVTIVMLGLIIRDSICEFRIRQGNMEVAVTMACKSSG